MSDWALYPQKALKGGAVAADYRNWQFHAPTLGYLRAFRPPPAKVISIGCNPGLFDFAARGPWLRGAVYDNDLTVLAAAETLSQQLGLPLTLEEADAFDLGRHADRFDVAYSAGLIEHWHGKRTEHLLREHARCAPLVQVEVPTPWTEGIDSVAGVTADMRPFGARELANRVRGASLQPLKVYALGSALSRAREVLESLLPPICFRRLQLWSGLSMGVGMIARR